MAEKIAIIGAGGSGLPAIKCCLEEGLQPFCFERKSVVGGMWWFADDVREEASVMKTTVINTSKEGMSYSDFPMPSEFPPFMHNRKVFEYFQLYSKKFDLEKHIKFQTDVLEVKKTPDFEKTGQWELTFKDLKTGDIWIEIYDAVLICTGHHAHKYKPHFEGEELFEGKIVHTHDYKDHRGYEDKRVVVIGMGNSGNDVATELSRICKQIYLSTRRGAWVLNRIAANGYPGDMLNRRRVLLYVRRLLPRGVVNCFYENQLNKRFDHSLFGLKPAHRLDAQHPLVNDELPNRLASGTLVIKPNIRRIEKRCVEFDDGSKVEELDALIYATGYTFGFPFIEKGVVDVKNNIVDLYKWVFPPHLEKRPTLAVIGCIQPLGSVIPISELQSRWAVRVFKGLASLPPQEEMLEDIKKKRDAMAARYVTSQRHTIQVDWIPYMDELARKVGCMPDIWKIFLADPRLGASIFFGPCTAYQYRLMGPGKWDGAREAIMTQWDRVVYSLNSKLDSSSKHRKNFFPTTFLFLLAIVILFIGIIMRAVLNMIT